MREKKCKNKTANASCSVLQITQKGLTDKNTVKRMTDYHIIPSTLCHDTVSRYKTIKSDGSDGLENHLTGRRQRVKGSFVPKHSLKCNSRATSPQRHLNQSGRNRTSIKEPKEMYSTI